MEERYSALYKALSDFDKDLNRLLTRKKDEEELLPLINRAINDIPRLPRYLAKDGSVDFKNTGLDFTNEEIFKIFLLTSNLNLSLEEMEYFLNQMNLNSLNTISDIKKLQRVFEGIDEEGRINGCEKEFVELGLSTEMLNYNVRGSIGFLTSYLIFKNKVKNLVIEAKNNHLGVKEFRVRYNEIYIHTLKNFIGSMQTYVNDIKKYNLEIDNAVKIREKFEKMLKSGGLETAIEVDDDFYDLDGLFVEYLKIINSNIKREYDDTIDKINKIDSEYEGSAIKKYLLKNNTDYKTVDKYLLDKLETLDDGLVERIIRIFEYCKVSCYDVLNKYYDLFSLLDEDEVSVLEELIDNGIITSDTLLNHLSSIDKQIIFIKTNYQILKDYVDFRNGYFDDELLFQRSSRLKNNILIIGMYKINKDIFIYLLSHMEKVNVLDKMLEKNIPLYLFMEIVNSADPDITIEKIIISNEIGLSYLNEEQMLDKSIIVPNKFLVPDEMVENYVVNENRFISFSEPLVIEDGINWDIVNYLDKQYRDNNCYNIENVNISRSKFIRNISRGDDIFTAMIRGSILKAEEMATIEYQLRTKEVKTMK